MKKRDPFVSISKSEIRRIVNDSIKSSDDLKILQFEIEGEVHTFKFPEVKELLITGITLHLQSQQRKSPSERMREILDTLKSRGVDTSEFER